MKPDISTLRIYTYRGVNGLQPPLDTTFLRRFPEDEVPDSTFAIGCPWFCTASQNRAPVAAVVISESIDFGRPRTASRCRRSQHFQGAERAMKVMSVTALGLALLSGVAPALAQPYGYDRGDYGGRDRGYGDRDRDRDRRDYDRNDDRGS